MSQFTTRYAEAANVAATLKQATTLAELNSLYLTNCRLIDRDPSLRREFAAREAALTGNRAPSMAEGWEG